MNINSHHYEEATFDGRDWVMVTHLAWYERVPGWFVTLGAAAIVATCFVELLLFFAGS